MKTTTSFEEIMANAAKYKDETVLTRKQRLYLESLVRAELKALRRANKHDMNETALSYMEARHDERMTIYEAMYGKLAD